MIATGSARIGVLGAVAALIMTAWPASAQDQVVFDNRQNVNILNASNVVLHAGQNDSAVSKLRMSVTEAFWDGVASPPGGTNWITMDFQTNRNIKTVRMFHYANSYANGGSISTSDDGVSWTSRTNWSSGANSMTITLPTAIDARYLRIDATDIADGTGTDRWILYDLRVFGDTGTLTDPDGVIDLVSSSGFNAGETIGGIGSVTFYNTITPAQFIDDTYLPVDNKLIYSIDVNEGFKISFATNFIFKGMGLIFANGFTPLNAAFKVETSTNDSDYTTWFTQSGTPTDVPNYYSAPRVRARFVKFTFTSSSSTDNRVMDVQLFGFNATDNRAPTASAVSAMTTERVAVGLTLAGVDPDGDSMTYAIVASPANGNLTGAGSARTYTPANGFVGTDSFTYTVTDGVLTSAQASATIVVHPDGTVIFDSPENVNLASASNVVFTAGQTAGTEPVSSLRSTDFDGYWDGGDNPPGGINHIDIDFRTNRVIKTVRLAHYPNGDYSGTAGTVSTSPDGSTWTPQPSSWVNGGHANAEITLTTAISSRYLRVEPTAYFSGTHRWILEALRVFGDATPLADVGGVLDLVSSTAFSGGQTLTTFGSVTEYCTAADYVNDRYYPIFNHLLYGLGTGDGFIIQFDRVFTTKGIGLFFENGYSDAGANYTIDTSTNGVTYTNVLTKTGGLTPWLNYEPLTSSPTRYLKFTLTSSGLSDFRITDVHVFGGVPLAPAAPAQGTQIEIR